MELAKALVGFQAIVPVIPKNKTAKIKTKTGSDYSYSYADLADIWEAIRQPLKDNNLAVLQCLVGGSTGWTGINTIVIHESGEKFEGMVEMPTQGKTAQEVGSLITYYKRYALGAALGISTEDDDDGKAGNEKPTASRMTTKDTDQDDSETLARAKKLINKTLETNGYDTAVAKIAFITSVTNHAVIDNLDEADLVMDALENEAMNNELREYPEGVA